ncbi:MAG: flagellar protein FlaG [Proteobacteria bacterium]|nr:flagellar protein FlaG [Pseudomonadota bacterium]
MISEGLNVTGTVAQKLPVPSEKIEVDRKKLQESSAKPQEDIKKKDVQPEELLKQIKGVTDNGIYSLHFERDTATNQLVVKIIDNETKEVIRQVPAEELLGLKKALSEFQGNIVDTTS